jgi:hypothetical protein
MKLTEKQKREEILKANGIEYLRAKHKYRPWYAKVLEWYSLVSAALLLFVYVLILTDVDVPMWLHDLVSFVLFRW